MKPHINQKASETMHIERALHRNSTVRITEVDALLPGRAPQAPAIGAAAQQSTPRLKLTDLEQLRLLMKQTKESYPAQEVPPETIAMWLPAWMTLAALHGIPALRTALQAHMLASRYFPHPSELRKLLDAMKPAQANVFVPQTRLEVARLCGEGVAERLGEMSVEDVARIHGAESARLYRAKLQKEGKNGGRD